MQDLERQLRGLKKPEPSAKFCRDAKSRLMHKIILQERESWLVKLLKKMTPVNPSSHFVHSARIRLLQRISVAKQPVLGWFIFAKRLMASTLVMTLAVTTTLFFIGGKQPVSAAENTYLEILSGSVSVKHADRLVWDTIVDQIELSSGDLIQVGDEGSAVLHFFDDSELRLSENSLLLLSRLEISPGYPRQGIIEASLRNGRAWVQTLNVDDGYADFSLITPDAIISTQKASYDVEARLFNPTVLRVFKYGVDVQVLQQESRDVVATGKLNSLQKTILKATRANQKSNQLSDYAVLLDLDEFDHEDEWVLQNLTLDRDHLTELRDREIIALRSVAGSLPGDVFYPVARAAERLSLVWHFGQEGQAEAQVKMANRRLQESIILIEQGDMDKARLALMEYQTIVRQLAQEKEQKVAGHDQLANRVITTHQKTLIAALPGDSQIGIVKQALDEAAELLAEDSTHRTEIRFQNVLDSLIHVQDYVDSGDLEAAKTVLADHEVASAILLNEANDFKSDDEKKAFYENILDIQQEEQRLLAEIARRLAQKNAEDTHLAILIKNADKNLDNNIRLTASLVRPLMPDITLHEVVRLPIDEKVHEFVEKVNIYNSDTGQKNQIARLLNSHPQYARDMEFLTKVRAKLDPRAKDIINIHILQLKRQLTESKSKRVEVKIKRAMDLRE